MFKKAKAGSIAAVSVLALSLTAAKAEPIINGEMEWGFAWVGEDSYEFGQYTGLVDDDAYLIGNIDLTARGPADSGDTAYWIMSGSNIGLDSGQFGVEIGRQGLFSVYVDFNQIPRFQYDDGMTPFIVSSSGTSMTLPLDWIAPLGERNPGDMPMLNASLRDLKISTDRERYAGGLRFLAGERWTFTTDFSRDLKTGNRTFGAIFAASGGNPAGAIVPEPVDYQTDNLNVSLAYADKKAQFVLSYNLSVFEDENEIFTFQNPYASTSWVVSARYPDGFGGIATPPDNKAQKFSLMGGYNVSKKTRVTANLSVNKATQDEPFLDFTIDPLISVTTPLPRADLDGEIKTTIAKLAVTHKPSPKANLKASYRYEDRDNGTPRDVFIYVPSDSADQGDLSSARARINMPYSREMHQVELDAAYRVSKKVKLSGGYVYEQIERDYQEVAETTEHKVKAKLRFKPNLKFNGWIGVSLSERDASDYIANMPYSVTHTEDYHGGPMPYDPDHFENNPLMNKFYFADRDEFKVKAVANFLPSETAHLTLTGRYSDAEFGEGFDDYGDGHNIGRDTSEAYSVTLDGTFTPSKTFNAHAFVTFDNRVIDQVGLDASGYEPYTTFIDFDNRWWSMETDDQAKTIGLGAEWLAVTGDLSVTVDLLSMRGETSLSYAHAVPFTGGAFSNEAPWPDLKTDLFEAEINAKYKVTDKFSIRLQYLYQDLEVDDFALDDVYPDTSNYVILLGNEAPDHGIHMVGLFAGYQF